MPCCSWFIVLHEATDDRDVIPAGWNCYLKLALLIGLAFVRLAVTFRTHDHARRLRDSQAGRSGLLPRLRTWSLLQHKRQSVLHCREKDRHVFMVFVVPPTKVNAVSRVRLELVQ